MIIDVESLKVQIHGRAFQARAAATGNTQLLIVKQRGEKMRSVRALTEHGRQWVT